MKTSSYSKQILNEMARRTLKNYRRAHKDRICKYIFDVVPWHVTISENGVQLNVQIKNRETNWTENQTIAL
jgi:hypothetical protein